jgi:anti-sigma B factor antagonist
MELDVAVRTDGNVTVVDVSGEVDLYTAPRLEEALAKASGRTPPLIVVNLGRTTYLDSTALRVLTAIFKRVRERQGEMAIAEVQPKIAKLFTLTGLDQVLPLCPTEREALDKVHQPPAPA